MGESRWKEKWPWAAGWQAKAPAPLTEQGHGRGQDLALQPQFELRRPRTPKRVQEIPELKGLANKTADLRRAHRARHRLVAVGASQNDPYIGLGVSGFSNDFMAGR